MLRDKGKAAPEAASLGVYKTITGAQNRDGRECPEWPGRRALLRLYAPPPALTPIYGGQAFKPTLLFPTRLFRPEPLPTRPLDSAISWGHFRPKPSEHKCPLSAGCRKGFAGAWHQLPQRARHRPSQMPEILKNADEKLSTQIRKTPPSPSQWFD
jgi:hypothetical protein